MNQSEFDVLCKESEEGFIELIERLKAADIDVEHRGFQPQGYLKLKLTFKTEVSFNFVRELIGDAAILIN